MTFLKFCDIIISEQGKENPPKIIKREGFTIVERLYPHLFNEVIHMWKEIKDFPNYSVSDSGEVKNNKTGRILKKALNQDGYEIVQLWNNGKGTTKRVHRLVLEAFKPIENTNYEVNHLDRDRTNNNLNNLEWVSSKQNIHYRDANDNPNKRTRKIKVEFTTGEIKIFESLNNCAEYFDLHPTTIRDYIDNKLTPHRKIQAIFTRI